MYAMSSPRSCVTVLLSPALGLRQCFTRTIALVLYKTWKYADARVDDRHGHRRASVYDEARLSFRRVACFRVNELASLGLHCATSRLGLVHNTDGFDNVQKPLLELLRVDVRLGTQCCSSILVINLSRCMSAYSVVRYRIYVASVFSNLCYDYILRSRQFEPDWRNEITSPPGDPLRLVRRDPPLFNG